MVALEIRSLDSGREGIPREAALRLLEGNEQFAAGKLDHAVAAYEDAINRHPRFTEALNNLGAALGQMGRSTEALSFFKKSLEIQPDDSVTLGNVGLVYLVLDQLDEALDYFGRSLKLDRNHKTLNNRATLWSRLGRPREALDDLTAALELAPSDAIALFNRSGILLSLGRTQEALRDIEAVGNRLPKSMGVAQRRRQIIEASLRQLADSGFGSWSGGKPKGSKHPVKLAPGPSITELVHEGRR
jgi:tetratricopeptide (TPR) repeat protein